MSIPSIEDLDNFGVLTEADKEFYRNVQMYAYGAYIAMAIIIPFFI